MYYRVNVPSTAEYICTAGLMYTEQLSTYICTAGLMHRIQLSIYVMYCRVPVSRPPCPTPSSTPPCWFGWSASGPSTGGSSYPPPTRPYSYSFVFQSRQVVSLPPPPPLALLLLFCVQLRYVFFFPPNLFPNLRKVTPNSLRVYYIMQELFSTIYTCVLLCMIMYCTRIYSYI